MEHLTKQTFQDKVFNYEVNKEWKFEGDLPCIIDFYADWCGPCKMVAPILEELAKEYDGKINIYKVDTEVEQELAGAFGIRSIPSLLFVPKDEQPQMAQGALPKESFKQVIEDVLLKVKTESSKN
jgi:thioredoxin